MNNIKHGVHNRENPYTSIRRIILDGSGLSFAARGLLAYLLSKRGDWVVTPKDLEREGNIKKHARLTIMKELETAGHLRLVPTRDKKGVLTGKHWEVYEFVEDNPDYNTDRLETRQSESSTVGKPDPIINTDMELNTKTKTKDNTAADDEQMDITDIASDADYMKHRKLVLSFMKNQMKVSNIKGTTYTVNLVDNTTIQRWILCRAVLCSTFTTDFNARQGLLTSFFFGTKPGLEAQYVFQSLTELAGFAEWLQSTTNWHGTKGLGNKKLAEYVKQFHESDQMHKWIRYGYELIFWQAGVVTDKPLTPNQRLIETSIAQQTTVTPSGDNFNPAPITTSVEDEEEILM